MVVVKLSDGSFIFGLTAENVKRLVAGQPIRVTAASHGINLPDEIPMIGLMYGDSEQTILAELHGFAGEAQ